MTTDGGRQVQEESVAEVSRPVPSSAGAPHVVLDLQRRCGNRAVARMAAAGRLPVRRRVLQRLYFDLGGVRVDVDYGGLHTVAAAPAQIRPPYTRHTRTPGPAAGG